ncbi:hypothetical protein [Bradyrhizobium erythrophlei]|uniref:Uncharacterized protein n=1 Tax=Bradyrhizobium erythrophlei TaxID=1437360 RepID=A0A1M7UJL6_9BRAD|nr:hypothetical protein [Bradyrhizobium erythrophlei]SHN83120.1 hypothetical protein SAMN05444170_5406 [Bradyrhizobium erythrophlei]
MGGEESEQKHSNPEQPGGTAPIVVNGKYEKYKRYAREKIAEYFRYFWTWIQRFGEPLTVVTLLLFGATVGLYIATRDLVHDAENTAERQLRAYVGLKRDNNTVIKGVCPDCDLSRPVPAEGVETRNNFQILIKNFGQTPAYTADVCPGFIGVTLGANLSNADAEEVFQPCSGSGKGLIRVSTIWPGDERNIAVQMSKHMVEMLRGVRERKNDGYLIAKIRYVDIFDKSHGSFICYMASWDANSSMHIVGCDTGPRKDY